MFRCKIIICFDHLVKIRFHQLKYHIYISKFSSRRRKHDMLYFNNIRMTEQSKELDFSEDPCGIRDMLKHIIDFFYCYPFPSMGINGRTNNTITSFANNFLNLISACFPILCKEFFVQSALSKIDILDYCLKRKSRMNAE